jgi:hypothetical protein
MEGKNKKFKWDDGEDDKMIIIVMDEKFEKMKKKKRVLEIKNIYGLI